MKNLSTLKFNLRFQKNYLLQKRMEMKDEIERKKTEYKEKFEQIFKHKSFDVFNLKYRKISLMKLLQC